MAKVSKKKIPKKRLKKTNNKEVKEKAVYKIKKRQVTNILLTVLLLVVVILTGTMIYLNSITVTQSTPSFIKTLVNLNDKIFPKPPALAAAVNQQPITMAALDSRYNMLPAQYQQTITKQDMLSQLIDETLLLQEAAKYNITADPSEVDAQINTLLSQNQITMAQLQTTLQQRGLTLDEMKSFYRTEIIVTKLLNMKLFNGTLVTDTDIKDYYYRNPDQFTVPESRNVSHILICYNESLRCVSNLTKEEALGRAKLVRGMVNSTNFADLAKVYSDEPSANTTGGNIGFITLKDPIEPTFLNASFKLNESEVSQPVETVFGYHLIKVNQIQPEQLANLSSVYDQINQTLVNQVEQQLYLNYIGNLRNSSQIINYFSSNSNN